jgi:hypothetical protein
VNLLGENIHTVKKNTEALSATSKDNPEVNAPETNYIFMNREQNAEQSHNTKITNNFKINVLHPTVYIECRLNN